ncbi:hypothetical protein QYE76_017516 [Lolium multiflorum]|uniref:Uncharacterized protein n=1 Tax=Lolium multiflorum TaxID=4521 RepID=A0AAD8QEU3_LOLMU|nr:hypothetical protein QYE76_017516 [Lolium multiflorum]
MFKAALFSILGDNIVDPYMAFDHGKDAWDAHEAKFGVSDAGTELYVMEQYYDYRMTDERSVVEQLMRFSHLPKNSSGLSVPLDKFVAGGIIAKLPPSWRNFATFRNIRDKSFPFRISLARFMWKRRREQRTHALVVLREVLVPMWYEENLPISQV